MKAILDQLEARREAARQGGGDDAHRRPSTPRAS